jgi:hypothetical protein
MHKYTSVYNI